LYLFGTVTVLNTPVYAGSDAGVFNAIFYQMSLGRKLYRDVFDIKDPLFFHGYALFRQLLGISGPMAWETLLTALTVAVLFRIAWRAGLSAGPALLAVLTYLVFYFNPAIYQPLHTYHQALFFLFSAIALAFEDRGLPAGVLVAVAVLSKATLATFLPAVLVAVAVPMVRRQFTGVLHRLLRFAIGGLLAGSLVAMLLAVTGELPGYRDVFRANFEYTELISTALNWHNDPIGRAREVVGVPMLAVLGVSVAVIAGSGGFVLYRTLRQQRLQPADRHDAPVLLGILGVALACFAGWVLILHQAAWFNHYFASLAPAAFFAAVALPMALRILPSTRLAALRTWLGAGVLVTGALATGFFPASALDYRSPSCPFSGTSDVQNPEFADCLRTVKFASAPGRTFAVVGPNSNDTPVASTPSEFILGCRLFFQFPWHGARLLDEFVDCLDQHVDIVIAEDLIHFNQPVDQARAQRIDTIIRGKFDLVGQCGRFTIWERKVLRRS
jgi:hypothetical protein